MNKTLIHFCTFLLLSSTTIGQTAPKSSSDFGRMFPLSGEIIEEYQNQYELSDKSWYQAIKNATVRFNNGCTASFVSENGLLVTAAHCTPSIELQDYKLRANVFNDGYLAKSLPNELKANHLKVSQLFMSLDITDEMHSKEEISDSYINTIKNKYAQKPEFLGLALEVKRYFNDKKIVLHAYKEYSDIRLVFVPKQKVRKVNVNAEDCFPSYDFDVSFWRVYENGKPLNTSTNHLEMNQFNTKKEEPVFVAGFPGKTNRYKTPAELAYLSKHSIKYKNENLKNKIEILTKSIANTKEIEESDFAGQMCRIRSINALNNATNTAKQTQFVFEKLNDPKTANKVNDIANELELSEEFFSVNNELKDLYSALDKDSWALTYLSPSSRSTAWEVLFLHRLEKYRSALEKGESENRITSLMQDAFSIGQSFGGENSKTIIKSWLMSIEKDIHSEDPFLSDILKGKTVEEYIDYIFANSGFGSYSTSKATMENRELMLSNSNPIMVLSNRIADRYLKAKENAMQKKTAIDSLNREIVNIIFNSLGEDMIPNADATLRLSDGIITGYNYCGFENLNTTFNSIIRSDATGELDLTLLTKLPKDYRKRIAFISSSNDGTGGNSGSPLINKKGEFIGLVFKKGNHSEYPNDYIYDSKNIAISIHAQAIFLCMKYIYQADELMKEILK